MQVIAHLVAGKLFHPAGLTSFLSTAARLLIAGIEARDTELARYGRFELEGHSRFAARRQITEMLKAKPEYSISQALSAVARISRAKEEGKSPRGVLTLADPSTIGSGSLKVEIAVNRPQLDNPKHVCKLLLGAGGEDHDLASGCFAPIQGLASDGREVVGLIDGLPPDRSVIAQFTGENGSVFCCVDEAIIQAARFSGFQFLLTAEVPPSALLRKVLNNGARAGRYDCPEELVDQVTSIADAAQRSRHGCTIVLGDPRRQWRSGHRLRKGLPLGEAGNRRIAANLSSIDGAIQIDRHNCLVAFGGLLDGDEYPAAEDLARGGRYNSASRFTKARDDVAVVVVSADGPIAVFADGLEENPRRDSEHRPLDPEDLTGTQLHTWLEER